MKNLFVIAAGILLLFTGVVHAGTWSEGSAGGFSQVYIYTPDSVSQIGSGRSLLVVLHGCAQTNEDMKSAKWESAAEKYGVAVAIPEAMYKEGFQCWGYWTHPKNRNSKDYKNIRKLVEELLARSSMNIDPNQVYIAGLSSGGAFAMTAGCMMPDMFAGMGLDAAPSVGTDASCSVGRQCGTVNSIVQACRQLAESYHSYFDTQITSTAYGTGDYTVNQGYALQNAEAMAKIYEAQKEPGEEVFHEGAGGTITKWSIQDVAGVSMAKVNGAGHAWPGGPGASGGFIDGSGFNYGVYLVGFSTENNRRVARNIPPEVEITVQAIEEAAIQVTGSATDQDGHITASVVNIDQYNRMLGYQNYTTIDVLSDTYANFLVTSNSLPDGFYRVYVTATDNNNASTDSEAKVVLMNVSAFAPELSNLVASADKDNVTITGNVTDTDNDLRSVIVEFWNVFSQSATVSGSSDTFSVTFNDVPKGSYTATVTAKDAIDLSDSDSVSFEVTYRPPPSATATINEHCMEGRIPWSEYNKYFSKYRLNPFTVYQGPDGRWTDQELGGVGASNFGKKGYTTMVKKVYILCLKDGARELPVNVTRRVTEALNTLGVTVTMLKTTRAGCVVVEAYEELESLIKEHHPDLFIEEQKYLRPL
ncbi:MAG: PHB depolymerase family esterase [Planctomycetes bacterium]|nr:PHB depolymerase family esterase [Planctomycetota bacterium]